ncbi:MAG: fibronectin type III domain-containing protein, partial [Fibrobacteres bacterium]|nr:fibronectin type III domain-containing protein [Fibrobacterota bacterium]
QVTWSSEYAAFGKVQYGKTPACSEGEVSSGLDIDHVAILKGLTSDAVYFYRVISSNSEDADTSDVFAFSTRAGTNSIYKIKKLPANAIPAIDGNLQDWPREYIIGTITGDDNVFARESNSPMDASTNWNGELYEGWHDTIAYFAIRVTTDDVYKLGSGITPNQFDNIKVNPGGSGKAFYLWSDGVMTKNPACLFDNGTTLKQKVNSTSNGGLPVYEFSFPYDYLTPSVAIDEFRLNIGTEDADADGSSKLFLGFGVYYIGSKQEWETGNWNNPAYYPTFKLIE